jgi:hypothetical protein
VLGSPIVHRPGPPDRRKRIRAALLGLLLAIGLLLVLPAAVPPLAGPPLARGASPTPAAGDTRTPGEGAGFVGQPILAALGVIVLGCAAAGATALYLRTRRTD